MSEKLEEIQSILRYMEGFEQLSCFTCAVGSSLGQSKCDSKHKTSCILAFATIARNLHDQDLLYKKTSKIT